MMTWIPITALEVLDRTLSLMQFVGTEGETK